MARTLFGGDTSYAPKYVTCPKDREWIWTANRLDKQEESFLRKREQVVKQAVKNMMIKHGLPVPPRTPTIGYAISGGGYRSMITGLGGMMGLIKESEEAVKAGTGGWADAITYLAGLSGGSWATASWIANGGMIPLDMITKVWNLESNLIYPKDDKFSFYSNLIGEVDAKKEMGFPAQLSDYWALALGEQLLPKQYRMAGHPDLTISQLPELIRKLGEGELPMPIIIASQREEGEFVVAQNSTVWEFTPYSFGSWAFGSKKKVSGGFMPVEYLGTPLYDGKTTGTCVTGLDNLGFIIGTSATLFNGLLLELNETNSNNIIVKAVKDMLLAVGEDRFDVCRIPNPFKGWWDQENPLKDFEYLTLVDAGETDQNIPLEPLLVPERHVDAIIAFDASRQTATSWPNGSSIHTTFTRAHILDKQADTKIQMPNVPTANGFVNGELNTRPTFFGCEDTTTPLIVYIPQYPWTYYSNKSTFQLDYDLHSATETMLNGMRSLTLNQTVPIWPKCLSCALTDRSFYYTPQNRTGICQDCFDTFCWDGLSDDTKPKEYNPVLGVPDWLEKMKLVKPEFEDGKKGSNHWANEKLAGLREGGWKDWTGNVIKIVGKKMGVI
ncbi:uncharacterized protein I206_106684 [Kwoniella pini CBS 10737]|uniref:Lysophospholipase n=1 Tax=Kwoniella pini CBS 10737 TaxID=1296096 RepID=A0A1B9HTI0_9TREE|nr:uncharacterized protein I206_07427 [Kwoniella pini CBS 10737]OCF46574.1 hypothetical protein I206_07427 [Kwoniella pini CBS 10737]